MPTKSVCGWPFALAWAASLGSAAAAAASFHSGELAPNTRVMSPVALVAVFSSSMFAVPTPPTSQPARVNGTQGAGVVFCPSVIMFGSGSNVAST